MLVHAIHISVCMIMQINLSNVTKVSKKLQDLFFISSVKLQEIPNSFIMSSAIIKDTFFYCFYT